MAAERGGAAAHGPVELLLQVVDATGSTWSAAAADDQGVQPPTDLRVLASPDHTVADLTAALGEHLAIAARPSARLVRSQGRHHRPEVPRPGGQPLDPSSLLGDIGLRSGERLAITTGGGPHVARGRSPAPAAARPETRVVVASGPDVGRTAPIDRGVTVGRDRSCELQLHDPTIARRALRVTSRSRCAARPSDTRSAVATLEGSPVAIVRPLDGTPFAVDATAFGGADGDGDRVPVRADEVIRVGATTLRVEAARPSPIGAAADAPGSQGPGGDEPFGEVLVHRPPSPLPVLEPVTLPPLGDLPVRSEPPRFGLLVALAPVLLGVTLAIVYSPRMLLFAVFAPVMAGAAYLEARRRNASRFDRAVDTARDRLAALCADVESAQRRERRARFERTPDLARLQENAASRPPRVWPHDRSTTGELVVRLGLGEVRSLVSVQPETGGDPDLRAEIDETIAGLRHLADAPITVDLTRDRIVAIVGPTADVADLVASIVLQIACRYTPTDLVVAAAVHSDDPASTWLSWLPHVRSSSSPIAAAHVAVGDDADRLLRSLLSVAEYRVTAGRDEHVEEPQLLVLIDASLGLDPPSVGGLLNAAEQAGISVVWLAREAGEVPWQAALTISCRGLLDEQPSTVSGAASAESDRPIEIDRLPPDRAALLARTLAPYRDAQADERRRLPAIASLGDALSVDRVDERWVERRWRQADGRSLPVPIGVTASGPFIIDLVQHGPHGLVGGTSGSGKSELLISLVASLVACHSPAAVNLLFIDYKGGSSSDPFVDLPHTVGCVTNLDAFLARRALVSLRAELNRRMAILAGRARDLSELTARFPGDAPPRLVIVVDELAALVEDVPDFVAGLVDIAQRGRSLGIHLLLATQRPAGVVNDNILANTNLRIALRMLDGTESASLVGTRDAAAIPTDARGRAVARLGSDPPTMFQSAWSGVPPIGPAGRPPIEVRSLRPARPTIDAAQDLSADRSLVDLDGATQLDEILMAVRRLAASRRVPRGHRPWHDELPANLHLRTVRSADCDRTAGGAGVVLGLLDEPGHQRQVPAVVDLATGGLAVFGSGGSGKSTALSTLAWSAALDDEHHGDGGLLIFGLDFGSRDLEPVGRLPHCVEVAAADDMEAVTRVIALLDRLVRERRSTKAGPERPAPLDRPRVLLLIDDYDNLAATFEGPGVPVALSPWLETINRVIVEGRRFGVHTALTASRRAAVRASVLTALTTRIVLRQAEPAGYAEFGLPSSLHDAELVPGRGFLDASTQIQIAITTDETAARPAPTEADDEARLRIGPLPTVVRLDAIAAGEGRAPATGDHIDPRRLDRPDRRPVVLGVADLAPPGEVVTVDLDTNDLAIVGEPGSGRSTTLRTIGTQMIGAGVDVWAVGPAGSPLADLERLDRRAFGDLAAVVELVEAAVATTAARPELAAASKRNRDAGPVLLVDDLDALDRPELERPFGELCTAGVRWVAATTTQRSYSTNPLVHALRRARCQLWLGPATSREIQEVTGTPPAIRPGVAMPPGRAVLVAGRQATVLQVAISTT